jgi:hypothetical protein
LIQASLTKGWDPRVIPARAGNPPVDLANWDKDPTAAATGPYRGSLPGGTQTVFPTDHGKIPTGPVDIFSKPTFATPDTSRETVSRGVRETLPVREPSDLFRGGR